MPAERRYTLDGFIKTGQKKFTEEFGHMNNQNLFHFESKTYIDEKQQAFEGTLLLVGRWYYSTTKAAGPMTWALSTSHGISYYCGSPGQILVPALQRARIYHDAPFDLMFKSDGLSVSQNAYERNHQVKEAIIEAAINFAFLLTGRISHFDNIAGTDVLGNFQFACVNLYKNSNKTKTTKLPLQQHLNCAESPAALSERQRGLVEMKDDECSGIDPRSNTALVLSHKRSRPSSEVHEDDWSGPRTYFPNLIDQQTLKDLATVPRKRASLVVSYTLDQSAMIHSTVPSLVN